MTTTLTARPQEEHGSRPTQSQIDKPNASPYAQGMMMTNTKGATATMGKDAWRSATPGTVPVKTLVLAESDEQARQDAPQHPGYCVDELCACDKHQCLPLRRPTPFEGQTTYRAEYVSKLVPEDVLRSQYAAYGPDGVPHGVDPNVWKEYVAKHGFPPLGKIPAHLYHRPVKDTRDFSTENRAQFTTKDINIQRDGTLYGPDGVPVGVDPKAWEEYVAKHGVPEGGRIPAHLYYRRTPDTRDFSTNYRTNYVPHTIAICPVARLPQYPNPTWPRQHTFWDPVAKTWY